MTAPSVTSIKDQARKLIEGLDDTSTWEDLVYLIYLQKSVDRGRLDIQEGRVFTTDDLRTRLGLPH